MLSKNENFPVDRWYNEDPTLNYADECDRFVEGNGVTFDVDGEITVEYYKDDDEVYALLQAWVKD